MSTPRKQAIEILANFKKLTTYEYQEFAGANYSTFEHDTETLKNLSIFHVDEILSVIPMYIGNLNPKWKFWNDVKLCLNAL
jgi:hypothetical protein